jgi:hypothetical protein
MKTKLFSAMLAVVLVTGLAFTGCDTGPDSITGVGENPGVGDPLPTHWYGCVFSNSANTSPRNGTHFLLSIPYADALEKMTAQLGTNDGIAVNPNLTSSLISDKINWVIIEEEVINTSLFHVRLIQDVNGGTSGVFWNYNPSLQTNTGIGGSGSNTDAKSISLTGISDADTIVRVGVLVLTELPTILSLPLPVAVGYGYNTGGGSASLIDLTVPLDTALYDGPAWTGTGDYYVAVAIDRGPYFYFMDGGENPVKAAFDKAEITLEFIKFKAWSPQ